MSTTSKLFMRNLGLRFIGRVTDGDASRALAGQSDVNAHLLTGNGNFVRVGKDAIVAGANSQHTRFQVAEPTRADFDRLARRPVAETPVSREEIITPPPAAETGETLEAALLFPADEEESQMPPACLDAYTLAIYFHEKRLSVRQARNEYGIYRRVHQQALQYAQDLQAEVKSLAAGNPPRSPWYQKLLEEQSQ